MLVVNWQLNKDVGKSCKCTSLLKGRERQAYDRRDGGPAKRVKTRLSHVLNRITRLQMQATSIQPI